MEKLVGSLGKGTGGIDDIVDDHDVTALDLADGNDLLNHIGLGAGLVADDNGRMQVLGIGVDALGAAHVGSGQRKGVLELLLELFEDAQEIVAGVEVVHGEIKEALDLVCVKVAGHDGIGPCHLEHVGHQLGTD